MNESFEKIPLEKTFFDFKKWVKSIQTEGCNGARTDIYKAFDCVSLCWKLYNIDRTVIVTKDTGLDMNSFGP